MKFVALVSGGKDSCYNILHCVKQGHELAALANLYPMDVSEQELNSFMFQTVGHDIVSFYDKCTGLPLFRRPIKPNSSKNVELNYTRTENDEIEDLYKLLYEVKSEIPDLKGVSVGAILSSYQRTRVEDVCSRLGLVALSYLWQRDQLELMSEMCSMSKQDSSGPEGNMDARIIKVAAVGLDESSLNKSLPQIFSTLKKLNKLYDVHICGEGGEFETMVIDAPFFSQGKLNILSSRPDLSDSNNGVFNTRLEIQFERINRNLDLKSIIKSLPCPPLLDEKWMALLLRLENQVHRIAPSTRLVESAVPKAEVATKVSIVKLGETLFISNIRSLNNSGNLEMQAKEVFAQLDSILKKRRLTQSDALFCSLILSDMSDFAQVNKIYSEFFSIVKYGPLPPARACVGSADLSDGCLLQLSASFGISRAKTDQEAVNSLNRKNGLHVQGRSYWAPCNIGPYSQAIWSSKDQNKVSYISGQIALDPPTMEMVSAKPNLQCATSLKHFDTLKNTIDTQCQLFMTCFISAHEVLCSVITAWQLYCRDMALESDDWSNKHVDRIECLIIVKIHQLPKQALCEWCGVACNNMISEDEEWDEEECDQETVKNIDKVFGSDPKDLPILSDILLTNTVDESRHFITGFADTKDDLMMILKDIVKENLVVLYFNPSSFVGVEETFFEQKHIDFFPVEEVYDYTGKMHTFGYHIRA